MIPELGDKQTLRRRNRGGARGGNRNAASANLSSANNHTNNDRCGKGNDKNSQLLNKGFFARACNTSRKSNKTILFFGRRAIFLILNTFHNKCAIVKSGFCTLVTSVKN